MIDFILAVLSFCCGGSVVYMLTDARWEQKSVEAGKAEYYLDENNERQWRWK